MAHYDELPETCHTLKRASVEDMTIDDLEMSTPWAPNSQTTEYFNNDDGIRPETPRKSKLNVSGTLRRPKLKASKSKVPQRDRRVQLEQKEAAHSAWKGLLPTLVKPLMAFEASLSVEYLNDIDLSALQPPPCHCKEKYSTPVLIVFWNCESAYLYAFFY